MIAPLLLTLASALWAPQANAFWAGPAYCPSCGMMGRGYYSPWAPSFYPSYYPWYVPYGAMSYPNYFYPTAWNGGGVSHGYFPGHGGGFMGKPNVYLEGTPGQKVSVRLGIPEGSNVLAAVPARENGAWEFTLGENLKSGGADYRYGFYDLRFDEKNLQDSRGFVAGRREVVDRIARILENAGFTRPEVGDFARYWIVKLPPYEKFYVYPQEAAELDTIARLEVTPKPRKVIRLAFLLIPADSLAARSGQPRFSKAPEKEWTPPVLTPAEKRAPASAGEGPIVREWSIGFLAGSK